MSGELIERFRRQRESCERNARTYLHIHTPARIHTQTEKHVHPPRERGKRH